MDDFTRIRLILLNEWDPIGVRSFETFNEDDDEYDGYAREICKMLADGRRTTEIEKYLMWAEENMELQSSPSGIEHVARLITGPLESSNPPSTDAGTRSDS